MNNREKYLKATSIIKPSEDFFARVIKRIEKESNRDNNVGTEEHDEMEVIDTISAIDQE